MASVTIDIKGLDAVITRMDKLAAGAKDEINDALLAFGMEVKRDAQALAQRGESSVRGVAVTSRGKGVVSDEGRLAGSIGFQEGDLNIHLVAAVFYAAYVEFGTGVFAAAYVPTLPQDLQDYAMTFYVDGSGRVSARPFMWPAIQKNLPVLEDDIKAIFTL